MALTIEQVLRRADDLRVDRSPGNMDINSDGVNALNAAIDYLLNKHYWPMTVRQEVVNVYPTVEKYGINALAKEIKTFRKLNGQTEPFSRVGPTTITNHIREGRAVNEIAFERGRNPVLYVNAYHTEADYDDNYLALDNSTDEPVTAGAGIENVEVLTDYDYDGSDVLSFSVVSDTAATLTVTHSPKDLSTAKGITAVFADLKLSSFKDIDSVTLTLTDLTGNTLSKVCTTTHDGNSIAHNQSLDNTSQTFGIELADFSKVTKTGAFDYHNVISLTLSFQTDSPLTTLHNCVLSNVRKASYEPYVIETYTTGMVKDVGTGAYVTHYDSNDTSDELQMYDEQLDFVAYVVAWKLLEMMDRRDLKEDRRMIVEGQYGTSGMVADEMKKYPAQVKKYSGPSIVAC